MLLHTVPMKWHFRYTRKSLIAQLPWLKMFSQCPSFIKHLNDIVQTAKCMWDNAKCDNVLLLCLSPQFCSLSLIQIPMFFSKQVICPLWYLHAIVTWVLLLLSSTKSYCSSFKTELKLHVFSGIFPNFLQFGFSQHTCDSVKNITTILYRISHKKEESVFLFLESKLAL